MRSTDRFHVRIQLSHEGWMNWHCERNVLATFFKNGGLWIAIEVVGGEGYWWVEETDSWVRYPLYENDSPNTKDPWEEYYLGEVYTPGPVWDHQDCDINDW